MEWRIMFIIENWEGQGQGQVEWWKGKLCMRSNPGQAVINVFFLLGTLNWWHFSQTDLFFHIYIYIQPTVYITFSFDWCEYWLWLEASHITLAYAQLRAVHFHMSLIRFYIIFSLSKLNYLSCFLFSLLLFPFRHVPLGENYWKYLPN